MEGSLPIPGVALYDLPFDTEVRLDIFNAVGQKVTTLVDAFLKAGRYQSVFEGKDRTGKALSSGVYFYRLKTAGFVRMQKKVFLK
jgi:hypothetical protein